MTFKKQEIAMIKRIAVACVLAVSLLTGCTGLSTGRAVNRDGRVCEDLAKVKTVTPEQKYQWRRSCLVRRVR